jgi:hypothetical protein
MSEKEGVWIRLRRWLALFIFPEIEDMLVASQEEQVNSGR